MKLTLGFSPCPNDTYIFDALVHGLVDTEGLEFEYHMADVEQLNNEAIAEIPDVSKVSFHAFLKIAGKYRLLDAGAALGFGTGPLLIAAQPAELSTLADKRIAVPGEYTTANLLFSIAFAKPVTKIMMLFSEIENAILSGDVDAGVIIHENRFTYQSRGLHKILDLGEFWENMTSMPVPLGGIVAHERLGDAVAGKVARAIRRSVEYTNSNMEILSDFIRCNAAEMDEQVMRSHINLYVNEYSVSLGNRGRQAVKELFGHALSAGIIDTMPEKIFA